MTPLAQEAAQARQARDQAASQVASTQEALEAARQNVAELQAALEAAETPQERIALTRQIAAAQRTVKNLEAQLPAADAALAEAERRLTEVLRDQERAIFGEFPAADRPIALLPVRLETRFVTTAGKPELLVRIYPDEIHVDTHEPGLTADESQWGRHFWAETWRTGSADSESAVARRNQIWEQIAQRFGAGRATWIVLALKPTNPGDRPAQPVAEGQPLPRAPIHPTRASRADSWTRAPEARFLPDRWIVLGYRGGERVTLEAGAPIAPRLAVGPDPSAPPPSPLPGDDQLVVDPGMRWLVDFDEAEKAGMGLRVPLTASSPPGFDTLIVFGVRSTQSPSDAATALADLIAAHRFTEGLTFIATGTPTNNTEARGSGFAPRTLDAPATYPVPTAAPLPLADANAVVLAHAFGIDADLLAPLHGASAREQADARAMQVLLWPATGGYFLEQLLDVFPDATLVAARSHFLDFARVEGPLPALRVGRQPYGLLPTTSLDRWLPTSEETPFLKPLRVLRDRLRNAVPKVPRLDRRQSATQAPNEAAILNVLKSSPTSSDYAARLAFDHALFGIRGFHTRFELPQQLVLYEQNVRKLLGALGVSGTPRLLATALANTAADLRDEPVLGPEDATPTEAQFLPWLRDSPYETIRSETGLAAKPNGLLYLVLRHSVLLAYAMTAFEIQRAGGAVDAAARAEPAIVDVLETRTRTVGRHPEHPLPTLGSKPLHTLTAADHPAAARLDEMRASLDRLGALPRERLEALFTGTLDLFAYRLDAWITSVATRRLHELRKLAPTGVIAGGFGWLENVRPAPPRQAATPPPDEAGSPLTVDPANAGFIHAPSLSQAATAAVLRSGYRAFPGEQDSRPFAVDLSSRRVRLAEWLLDGVRAGQPLGALLGYRFERALHDRRLDLYIAPFRRIAPFGELAKAEVTAQDTAAEAARLKTAPHPDLAAATTALNAAQTKHAALTQEQSRLPGQIAAADTKLKNLSTERAELIKEAQRWQERLRRFPNDEIAQEKLLDVNLRLREIDPQITSTQSERTRLKQRESAIPGEIAALDLEAKQKRVDDLKKLPHPGIAAAEKAAGEAKRRFDELLEAAREQRLYPRTASVEAIESAEVTHVVDGLALLALHQANAIPFGKKKLPAPNTADHRALLEELGALQAAVDSIRDALTAESVHQLVQGNPVRAGASLDAVARSEVPPPELEFARTPRSGIAVTHRVLILWNAPSQTPVSWPSDARQVRAGVEPVVHAWVASLLGDPQAIRCGVHYADPQSGAVLVKRDLRMQSAGLGPLDLLALVDESGAARPELERYLVDRALATGPQGMRADAKVKLVFERQADWPVDARSFAEALEVVRAASLILGNVRPARNADLALPDAKVPPAADLAELRARADAVVKRLSVAHAALDRALASEGDAAAIGNALVQMLFFGFAESVPALAIADTPEAIADLRTRARSVEQQARRRLDEARVAETTFDRAKATPEEQREQDVARIRTVLGAAFVVLPRIARTDAGELGAAMNDGEARFGGDRLAPVAWLDRMAHVRRPVERLQTILLYGEALGRASELRVAQLPFVAGERWTALPAPEGKSVPAGKLSIVAHTPEPLDAGQPLAGLFVDEWVELVPAATQTTGIAFNFDEPGAQPPQAVLLAVLPRGEARWGLDVIEATLLETLDLARLRAVAPEQIAPQTDLEDILPALYFALNLDNATVSTDFRRATGPA